MRTRIILMAGVAALASACTTQAGYQARTSANDQGYADVQVEPNRMLITYNGDTRTARETVEVYLLYRAAEATLERGFDYFVITDHDIEQKSSFDQTGAFRPRFGGASYREVTRHKASIDILMFKGERPTNVAKAYDANSVRTSLRPRITPPAK